MTDDRFREEFAGMWGHLCETTAADKRAMAPWDEYDGYIGDKLDDAGESTDAWVTMLDEEGYDARVMYSCFNRALIAARPRPVRWGHPGMGYGEGPPE